MVSYKQAYTDVLEQYNKLKAHSIDLRTAKIITFSKDKWELGTSADKKAYVLQLKEE